MRKNRAELEDEINAKAWKDSKFKQKLIERPIDALKEMGLHDLPSSMQIKVIEENGGNWCIVLHKAPQNASSMSEDELRRVHAAVGSGVIFEDELGR